MNYQVSKDSSIPLYLQTKEYLLDFIRHAGDSKRLPSENELSRLLGISRPTIRLALASLTQDGIIEKIHGKGTFIKDHTTEIEFMNWHETEKATSAPVRHVLQRFLESRPRLGLRNVGCPFWSLIQELMVLIGRGNAPDVMALAYYWIPVLAEHGSLHRLNFLYTPDLSEKLFPSTIDAVKYKGDYYALNWALGPTIFYYNRKILAEATGSAELKIEYFDELPDIFDAIHAKFGDSVTPFCLPIDFDDLFFIYTIYSFLLSFKGGITDPDGDVIFNSASTEEAFVWLRKFLERGHALIDIDMVRARQMFASNRIAFFIDGPWLKSIVPTLNRNTPIDLGFTTLPKSVHGLSYSALSNHSLAISNQSRNKEIALDFINYLAFDKGVGEYLYRHSSMFPSMREEVLSNPVYDDPFGRVLKKQMETAFPIPDAHPAFSYSISFCAKASREILLGHSPIPTVLNSAAEAIRAIYQARWL